MTTLLQRLLPTDVSVTPSYGLYIHWPFCESKCPYCDFNSHVRQSLDEARFAMAYVKSIENWGQRLGNPPLKSLFFGGGTPSLMHPDTLALIFQAIDRSFQVSDMEITLEANPSSVERARFQAFRDLGVNRVSLGVQSLREEDLRALGRLHSVDDAKRALETANALFPRVSFDLIYARQHQTLSAWEEELREAISLAAGHLSLYQLTIEDGTPFAALHKRGKLKIPNPQEARAFYELTTEMTTSAGYQAYEVSNVAQKGQESAHNLIYWRTQPYIGIGAGAHGRILEDGNTVATVETKSPEEWLHRVEKRGHGLSTEDVLTLEERADESLLMGLRLQEGYNPLKYQYLTGRTIPTDRILMLEEHGLIKILTNGRLRATLDGVMVLDAVVADLVTGW